jgi:uncharacterized flavoprotein (TIGR03862 family)
MAASVLADHGMAVSVFEKKRGPAPKLLIAGRSGLNISNAGSLSSLIQSYEGPAAHFKNIFHDFSVQDWLTFVKRLGVKTFEGTSRRYFIDGLTAPPLLKAWLASLKKKNVHFFYGKELTDFETSPKGVVLTFNGSEKQKPSAACFCLGGVSWEKPGKEPQWPSLFKNKKIPLTDFSAANVGYEVKWPPAFVKEADGLPLKNITLSSSQGVTTGEIMITKYGLEGSPIYQIKNPEMIFLDLKPDLTANEILRKLHNVKENLSPLRRVKKYLKLGPGALALLYHDTKKEIVQDIEKLVPLIKNFSIPLIKKRGLEEAISSAGGVSWIALDQNLMLKKFPGIFVAGEMLDWSAPTGGFLIQACVSQGYKIGQAAKFYCE